MIYNPRHVYNVALSPCQWHEPVSGLPFISRARLEEHACSVVNPGPLPPNLTQCQVPSFPSFGMNQLLQRSVEIHPIIKWVFADVLNAHLCHFRFRDIMTNTMSLTSLEWRNMGVMASKITDDSNVGSTDQAVNKESTAMRTALRCHDVFMQIFERNNLEVNILSRYINIFHTRTFLTKGAIDLLWTADEVVVLKIMLGNYIITETQLRSYYCRTSNRATTSLKRPYLPDIFSAFSFNTSRSWANSTSNTWRYSDYVGSLCKRLSCKL